MERVSHAINRVIFGLFLLLAIVLSLANWGIIQDMGCVSNIRSHIVSRFFLSNNV